MTGPSRLAWYRQVARTLRLCRIVPAFTLFAQTLATGMLLAPQPYMGWRSWSLESTNFPGVNTSGGAEFPHVSAPRAGTYLMTIAYVTAISRNAIVTINGTAFQSPLPGTNDNNWDSAQTQLTAGTNTIQFGNPTDYVSDIDKITV
jgi:hypothetical protein